jgi:hypothetical protein
MKITDPKFKSFMLKITALATFGAAINLLIYFKRIRSNFDFVVSIFTHDQTQANTLHELLRTYSGVLPWLSGYLFFISVVMWLCSLKSKSS